MIEPEIISKEYFFSWSDTEVNRVLVQGIDYNQAKPVRFYNADDVSCSLSMKEFAEKYPENDIIFMSNQCVIQKYLLSSNSNKLYNAAQIHSLYAIIQTIRRNYQLLQDKKNDNNYMQKKLKKYQSKISNTTLNINSIKSTMTNKYNNKSIQILKAHGLVIYTKIANKQWSGLADELLNTQGGYWIEPNYAIDAYLEWIKVFVISFSLKGIDEQLCIAKKNLENIGKEMDKKDEEILARFRKERVQTQE